MSDINIDKLLEPVSDETACGDDLEYDPDFGELERAAQGKEAHVMGEKEIAAEPPDWNEVFDAAEALLLRTKDLRVASYLAHASLNLHGIPGLAAGLKLVNDMAHRYWDEVHPQLDAEDDNDPTLRVNSLLDLNSANGFVGSLDHAVLVSSRSLGKFSMRHIRLSKGEISLPQGDDSEVPDPTHIEAAFLDCELDEITANSDAVDKCVGTLADLADYTREQVGIELAPDFSNLSAELKVVSGILREQLARRGVAVEPVEDADGDGAAAPAAAVSGEIRTREDAVRVLDKVSEYFRKNEPSSPVPLLLQRAKRLISMDFMEILRDLTPQGVSEAETIGGLDRDD